MSKKPSGAQYKKLREERELNKDKLLSKFPKLTTFFLKGKESGREKEEVGPSFQDKPLEPVIEPDLSESEVSEQLIESQCSNNHATNDADEVDVNNILPVPVFVLQSDPAKWSICEEVRDHVAQHGASQNRQGAYPSSKRHYPSDNKDRYLNDKLFYRQLKNGEQVTRYWMSYSESKGAVFCVPCLLFSTPENTNAFISGFNDWKNASQRVLDHENSPCHKTNLSTLKLRANTKTHVTSSLADQLNKETEYWRNVLKRVVAAVKFLAMKGLAFRGGHEHLGVDDNGNFLSLIEFLAEFDPFLAEHLKLYGDGGKGSTSYISKSTYEEFILLMTENVRKQILDEAKEATYFGIVVDSTPDISHIDQLTFVLRYVTKDGSPVERFLCFLSNVGHKAENIVNAIVGILEKYELDVTKCRGQSYDNASNMAGIYSGVQARIQTLCPQAEYVPCAAHSLNLVGSVANSSCVFAVSFFGLLQELYKFFTCSTHRWEVYLRYKCSGVLQSLSKTRWSARNDACRALKENWSSIIQALKVIENDLNEKPSCRSETSALRKNLKTLETAFLSIFWSTVLERFQKVSSKLQYETTTLSKVKGYYQSLAGFLTELRNDFQRLEDLAKEKSGLTEYKSGKPRKKKRTLADNEGGNNEPTEFTASDNFRVNTFNIMVDSLITELRLRAGKYTHLQSVFGFFEELIQLSSSEISSKATELWKAYENDLEQSVVEECLHLKSFMFQQRDEDKTNMSILEINKMLRKEGLAEVYPNIDIALRMVLSTPATNCTGERSFSTLRRVKNYLRSTKGAERLSATAILTIEFNLTRNVDYNHLINEFAASKSRKRNIV